MSRNASDVLVDTLLALGVEVIFGLAGDGINGVVEALRTRQDRIRFIPVRHEEAPRSWPAPSEVDRQARRLLRHPVRAGSPAERPLRRQVGPGAGARPHGPALSRHDRHLDAAGRDTRPASSRMSRSTTPRVMGASTSRPWPPGLPHRDWPTRRRPPRLPDRRAGADGGGDEPLAAQPAQHTSNVGASGCTAGPVELARAAEILNAGKRIVILAGQGAKGAGEELRAGRGTTGCADRQGAARQGRAAGRPSPTRWAASVFSAPVPSQQALEACDTLLIVGSGFPYVEYYPKPGPGALRADRHRPARASASAIPSTTPLPGNAASSLAGAAERHAEAAQRDAVSSSRRKPGNENGWRLLAERGADREAGR